METNRTIQSPDAIALASVIRATPAKGPAYADTLESLALAVESGTINIESATACWNQLRA